MAKKIALLGTGKTGKFVKELLSYKISAFDINNIPTKDNLKGHDAVISFLPGDAFLKYLPMLLETNIPVISGSTGLNWPPQIHETLLKKGVPWVWAFNFAPGMALVKRLLETLKNAKDLYPDFNFEIEETHHKNKKDNPSGTALTWADWIDKNSSEISIKGHREGDVIGTHTLTLNTPFEKIILTHESLDRKIFASGAILALETILNKKVPPGLNHFNDIFSFRN